MSPRRWWATVGLGFALLAGAVVGTDVAARGPLGLYDEWTFLDAVDKAGRGGVAQTGELVDEYALHISSCRGSGAETTVGSPCGGPLDPVVYPQRGVTSADIHPPTYFVLTAVGARAVQLATPVDELVDAARATGVLWLWCGLLLVALLARRLGAGPVWSLVAAAACVAVPLVRTSSSHVTPDAAALVVGAGVALAVAAWLDGGRSWWLAAASAGAAVVKAPFVLVVACCVLVVLLAPGSRRRRLWGAACLALPAGVVTVAWLAVRRAIALGNAPVQAVVLSDPSLSGIVSDLDSSLALATDSCVGRACDVGAVVGVWWAIGLLAALVAGVARRSDAGHRVRWAVAVAAAAVLAGPMSQAALFLATGTVFATPARYSLVLVPVLAAVAAASFAQAVPQPSRTDAPGPATFTA